jgi:hypothetical protein
MPIYSTTSYTANLPMGADDGVTHRAYSFALDDFTHFAPTIPTTGIIRGIRIIAEVGMAMPLLANLGEFTIGNRAGAVSEVKYINEPSFPPTSDPGIVTVGGANDLWEDEPGTPMEWTFVDFNGGYLVVNFSTDQGPGYFDYVKAEVTYEIERTPYVKIASGLVTIPEKTGPIRIGY